MKLGICFLLFVLGYGQCRKAYTPIDKNANIAFINMEGGGPPKPVNRPTPPAGPSPAQSTPNKSIQAAPAPVKPQVAPGPTKASEAASVPAKPPQPAQPLSPTKPAAPVPVKPSGPSHSHQPSTTVTTPGPGSVKHLINFYDSQGKASPIRPYSYSQAVKQG